MLEIARLQNPLAHSEEEIRLLTDRITPARNVSAAKRNARESIDSLARSATHSCARAQNRISHPHDIAGGTRDDSSKPAHAILCNEDIDR